MTDTKELIERRNYLNKKLIETESELHIRSKVTTRSCWFKADAEELKKELEKKGLLCELVATTFGWKVVGYEE